MKLATIGTCGRKEDGNKLSQSIYNQMINKVSAFIECYNENLEVIDTLISGGAAYGDNVSIKLFLDSKVKNLILHLPCSFDTSKNQFFDTKEINWKTNPGGTANYYHRIFSQKCCINSLKDITKAIHKGAKIYITPGFMERNTKVAQQADMVYAMTFGEKYWVKDGGTKDTVRKFLELHDNDINLVKHLSLNEMKSYWLEEDYV